MAIIKKTIKMSVGEDMEIAFNSVGGIVNWFSHYVKLHGISSKKKKKAISLQVIYLKKMKTVIRKDRCIPMFIAALLTTAKIQKQPKCSSIDESIKKL